MRPDPRRLARTLEARPSAGGASTARPVIPLARPDIGPAEEEAVLEVLRSGHLSLGPRLPAFEAAFAHRVGATHASAVSSGTAALHLALRAVGVGEGDEVVTTPFSFVATANAVLYERARPVFADIDPETLNLDPGAAAAAMTERTAALLPVHVFGAAADLPAFEALGPPIVEDAAEALGTRYPDGTLVGSRGHPTIFAFYPNKQITTGEGGMLVGGSAALKTRVDSERNQGRAPDMGWLDHDRLGFNYRLSDIACALGLAQLERLDALLAARAELAARYADALSDVVSEHGVTLPGNHPGRSWFVYVVQLAPGTGRDAVIRTLAGQGVQAKPYFPAIHLYSFYRERFGHRPGEFPVCEDVAARSLALPFFPGLTEDEVAHVADALEAAL